MAPAHDQADVLVVVRAWNEAAAIGGVLAELCRAGYPTVVVDDGSTDDTARVVRGYPVGLVRHATNLGPGAALATGFEVARRSGAAVVATFDADGQHRVDDLARVVEPVRSGAADAAFGSRFLRAEDRALVPLARRALLRGAVVVDGLLTGAWLSDAHNGLRGFSRAAVERIRLRESSFAYASELLAEVRRLGLRLVEVPVTVRYTDYSRRKGQSGWNAIDIVIDYLANRVLR